MEREFGTGLREHLSRHGVCAHDRGADVAAAKLTAALLFELFSGAESERAPARFVPVPALSRAA